MPRKTNDIGFWDAAGAASAAIGDESFYDRLLEVLGSLVETDLLALVRYSSFGAPDLIIPREHRAEVEEPYSSGFYTFDPFHHYWQTVAQPAVKPLRLIDRSRKELAVNAAWKKLAAEPGSGLPEAIARLTAADATQIPLPDGRLLIRSLLAADFGAAPGGLCDQVEVPALSGRRESHDSWLAPLTQRERQIVRLTLEGHPIAGIAKRLGVSRGTVKNHRLRLYQKLDITTERELFLTHMRHLHGAGG